MVGIIVELSIITVVWAVLMILWTRRRDREHGISPNIAPETKQKYRLDELDFLKSLRPTSISSESAESRLSTVLFALTVGFLILLTTHLLMDARNLRGGMSMVTGIMGVTASAFIAFSPLIVRSLPREIRIELGVDPCVAPQQSSRKKTFAWVILFVVFSYACTFDGDVDPTMLSLFVAVFIAGLGMLFHRTDLMLTDQGIVSHSGEVTWANIAWYRWYDHDEGVLLGFRDPDAIPPFIILPTTPENASEIAALLERYLPEKRFDDIETGWMPQEAAASLMIEPDPEAD